MTVFAPLVILWAGSTPTPVPAYEGDVNLITPGVVGFAVTFLIAIATELYINWKEQRNLYERNHAGSIWRFNPRPRVSAGATSQGRDTEPVQGVSILARA